MVSSIEAFERYQEKDAWVWEHQALTRARYCAGDASGRARRSKRSARRSCAGRATRRRSGQGNPRRCARRCTPRIPNRSGLFDVKHDRGGMIDIEFAVQYLVLGLLARASRL